MTPQPDSIQSAQGMLTEDPAPWAPIVDLRRQVRWVVGFWNDRAAQITELQWADPPASNPASRSASADVDVSLGTPLGPWQPVGTWELARAADGAVPPFVLPGPTWARFVRFTMAVPQTQASRWELPSTLRVIERPTGQEYRSILAEWGQSSPGGIHEALVPPAVVHTNADAPDAGDSPETATDLSAATEVDGRVTRHKDVDWYTLTVPAGQDTLTFTVVNSPGGGVALDLEDASGKSVRVFGGPTEDPAITV